MDSPSTFAAAADTLSQKLVMLQVLLVGDSAVGKSCLLMRFTADRFDEVTTSTIGEAAVAYCNCPLPTLPLSLLRRC